MFKEAISITSSCTDCCRTKDEAQNHPNENRPDSIELGQVRL